MRVRRGPYEEARFGRDLRLGWAPEEGRATHVWRPVAC